MFDFVEAKRNRAGGKTATSVALVIALHLLIVGAVVIVPIVFYDELPMPHEAMTAFAAAPPPPPPPPPPPAAQAPQPPAPPEATPVGTSGQTLAPVEAPDRIGIDPAPAPQVATGPISGGVANGIVGGIAGGVAGGTVGGLPGGEPAQGPVRVGGQIKTPNLLQRVEPDYPALARNAQAQGIVILEAVVDTSGRVQSVRVLRGHQLLSQAAIDAVKQWRYSPLVLNGQPTPFVVNVTVTFKLK